MLPFLVAGLALGSMYALSGTGLVLLYRASGTLNLAQGAFGAIAVLVSWELNEVYNVAQGPALVAGFLLAPALSVLWGWLVGPRLSSREPVVRATATLGPALALLGLANYHWNDKARTLRLPTDLAGFDAAGVRISLTQVLALVLTLGTTAVATVLLRVTRTGTAMRALADDRELSSMLGVRVRRVEVLAWAVSGVLAGASAILLAGLTVLSAGNLTFLVIPALAAALMGRLVSLWATLAGGLGIGVLQAAVIPVAALSPYRNVIPFVCAVAMTLWLSRRVTYTTRTGSV
ncbi:MULTISPECIES: branched-chain amino acid ABC transporter permease [unclassified Frankia]|uniref:branched-chain amino acid ABC transporter permease n=1 Tax=unclassified Frankia TaxID=2632575 RepID=UPI002AD45358|nr:MULTISPECIES: branched-chain amino acid ABC transporter permease [unclassified Frankia]